MYKIRGKVINVEEIDINTTKGDFVKKLVTIEELDSDFNHQHQFEISVLLLDNQYLIHQKYLHHQQKLQYQ